MTFAHNIPIKKSMIFETLFEGDLAASYKDKMDIKMMGAQFLYIMQDKQPIAETYYIELREDVCKIMENDEKQPEMALWEEYGKGNYYVWSMAVLPEYQGHGYGKILKAYMYGLLTQKAKSEGRAIKVLGHAKEGPSIKLNLSMGAEIVCSFPNWYETGDMYHLYQKILK